MKFFILPGIPSLSPAKTSVGKYRVIAILNCIFNIISAFSAKIAGFSLRSYPLKFSLQFFIEFKSNL